MNQFAGTGALVRATVRRDRVRLAVWLVSLGVLVVVTVAATKGLYPDQRSLDEAALAAQDNPAVAAFNGPAVALDTIGGEVAFQLGAVGLTMIGLMTLLLLNRVTRVEEDAGHLELVRALPVGRDAPLAAGFLVVGVLDIGVAAITTVTLLGEGLPVAGSLAMGVSFAVLGFVFLGVTGVCAQVSENPRVVSGVAGAVLGAAYLVRAIGDAGSGALSWASPIGWAQKARPYAGESWWPLALCLVVAAVLVALAVGLSRRRDFAAGLVPPSPGPARGARRLDGRLGLAVRLQRGVVVGWTVGVLSMAVAWGSVAGSIDDFVQDNDAVRDFIARSGSAGLVDSYLATSFIILALIVAGAALQIVTRVRAEEADGRAEALLAGPLRRSSWVGGHLAVALGGGLLGLVAGGFGLGVTVAVALHDGGQVLRLTVAALAQLPAVGVLAGLAVLVLGRWPRSMSVVWGYWGYCFVIAFFGQLLGLPRAFFDLSPFEHVPLVPAEPFRWLPIVLLAAVAAVVTADGLRRFDRRDLG
jgi:ABC-2 type transport system permease protein